MNTFSIDEAIAFGWKVTKEKFWFLVGWMLIMGVIGYIPAFLTNVLHVRGMASGVLHLIAVVVEIIVAIGSIRMFLNLVDGNPASYKDLWREKNLFLPYVVASIVAAVLVLVGFMIFIVPGIIVAMNVLFYRFFIVDKKAGIIESLKLSSQATKGNRWQLLGFTIVLGLLNLAGVCVVGIGLFVTMPLTFLALTYVYRKLSSDQNLPVVASKTPLVAVA